MSQRSPHIPIERGMAETILARLIADYGCLMRQKAISAAISIEIVEELQSKLMELADRPERTAKRITAMFKDRAEFGHRPNRTLTRWSRRD